MMLIRKKHSKLKYKLRIYTDGACSGNPGRGGWAGIILEDEKTVTISGSRDNTTNNIMELVAVVESLRYIRDHNVEYAEIYSDSAYVINAINNGWLTRWSKNSWRKNDGDPIKNPEIWKQLLKLLKEVNKVMFIKVAGHSGNHYNEMADKVAKGRIK